jgi:hypothetical protein
MYQAMTEPGSLPTGNDGDTDVRPASYVRSPDVVPDAAQNRKS